MLLPGATITSQVIFHVVIYKATRHLSDHNEHYNSAWCEKENETKRGGVCLPLI